ncbi:hypothetical protein [Saccharothrix coeruleofusca]|uniref:Uncharacterized protein n=1 Tax=Saccharothrix coeruleofusca TaxID=33919 RepID=A0A918ALH8_9PSEU|nr:hypothetical protein [Saccharothrix coeruleofusca]MBP2339517.1 hypothetical protein [Saccharothrix coeruleofusca]GGP57110.1 hypothetical protein GCM10010185_31800 [Saccharothrix coeruleofusca]
MTTPQDPYQGQQPHGQQQPYVPAPPPLSESEVRGLDRPPAPKEVQISFWIWITGAVLSALGSLLALTERDALVDQLRRTGQGNGLSEEELQSVATASLMFAVVLGLLFAGLYVLFAFKARAGRNWARLVLTVLTGLNLLVLLLGASWLGLLTALISVVAVVLLYTPNAKSYFDAVKRQG